QLQAYPFRMTARNMARHRTSPHMAFWKMLKTGSDHFEATHQEPKVDVCDRRYVFDAASSDGKALSFNARAKCPVYEVPQEIASLVAEKEQKDNAEYASLVSQNISVVASRKGIDGGMNPVFYAKLNPQQVDGDSNRMPVVPIVNTPGALPRDAKHPQAQTVPPAQPATEIELAAVQQPEQEPVVAAPTPQQRSSGG